MLKVQNIEIVYHDVILAVRGISLQIPPGGIVALLGSNGAGKSTTLKAISNILEIEDGEIEEGSIEFEGQRIDHLGPEAVVRMGLLQVPEGRGIFDYLTPSNCDLEKGPLELLTAKEEVMVYHHKGFWKCMDTMRDMGELQQLWKRGQAPWV